MSVEQCPAQVAAKPSSIVGTDPPPEVVVLKPVVVVTEEGRPSPKCDSSSDNLLDKSVRNIVRCPGTIVTITGAIAFALTIIAVVQIYNAGSDVFATSSIGNEDREDIRTLNFDAVREAKADLWPVLDDGCDSGSQGGRPGFRRLNVDVIEPPQSSENMLQPVVLGMMNAIYDRAHISDGIGSPPPRRPPTIGSAPRYDLELGDFIWETKNSGNRQLQVDACGEGTVSTQATSASIISSSATSWDFSRCDPFTRPEAKLNTSGPIGIGATGIGCNRLCDPESDSECVGTQTQATHRFIIVMEAVSGPNAYYQNFEESDQYGLGPGNIFTEENLKEMKRIESVILADPGYTKFCQVLKGPDGVGRCAGMMSALSFFSPREPQTAADMIDEAKAQHNPSDPTSLLETELGCSLQWFMFDLFQGPSRNMYALLNAIATVIGAQPSLPDGSPNPRYNQAIALTELLIAQLDLGFDHVYDLYCADTLVTGRPPKTEVQCNAVPGCTYQNSTGCVKDAAKTAKSAKFADIMCNGDGSGPLLTGTAKDTRATDLAYFHSQEHLRPFLDYYFDKGFSMDNPVAKYTRGSISFGGPIDGYKNLHDGTNSGKNQQESDFVEWFMESIRAKLQDRSEASTPEPTTQGHVEVTYLLTAVIFDEIFTLIIGDILLAIISFVLVGFYMWFQTGSAWIAIFGMAEISVSLPLSYLIYTFILGIEYFDFMCALSVYIVLAIGADDVFIWFDAYKQSRFEDAAISGTLETRFIWAWRKAASAMLVTSVTTCAAFLATATSPLLSIQSFGLFTALVIFLDYIFVITWLPAATVLYHRWFENTGFGRCSCCCASPQSDTTPQSWLVSVGGGISVALPVASVFSISFFLLGSLGSIYAKAYVIGTVLFFVFFCGITIRVATTIRRTKEGRSLVEFFQGPFSDFITANKVRYVLLAVSMCTLIPLGIAALQISPATKDEQILPEEHPLQKVITIMNNEFPVSGRDDKVRAEIAFGIAGYDRKGASPLYDYRRNKEEEQQTMEEVVFDTAFDWVKPETHQYLLSVCDMLDRSNFVKEDRSPDCQQEPCPVIKTACVVHELAMWLNRSLSDCEGVQKCKSAGATIPADDPLGRTGTYFNWYNVPNGIFLPDCFASGELCIPEDRMNVALWDFYKESWSSTLPQGVGFADATNPNSQVKYVILQFSLDMKDRAHYTNTEAMSIYTKVDEFVSSLNLPSTVGSSAPIHTTTSGKWKFMHTQDIYVKYALGGIGVAICLAYAVLMVATNNIIVSSLAVFTISSVCLCILGFMVLGGWELGNIESICLTILAGFCVDYIVHLAHSFMESPDKSSRNVRVRYSVGHMGVSVLSGALTSMGASSILFFCTLQFFTSFGSFFFATIFFAWLWGNFFFIPALGTIGPTNTTGDICKSAKGEDNEGTTNAMGNHVIENPACEG